MDFIIPYLRGILGIFILLLICFALSSNRKNINWRLVVSGISIQLVLALLVLKVDFVKNGFDAVSSGFVTLLNFTKAGSEFLFGSLVTDTEGLPWNVLSIAISQLIGAYNIKQVPIMFYPIEYVENKNVPYEKVYQAWVLDVRYGNEYMEYMQKKFKIT